MDNVANDPIHSAEAKVLGAVSSPPPEGPVSLVPPTMTTTTSGGTSSGSSVQTFPSASVSSATLSASLNNDSNNHHHQNLGSLTSHEFTAQSSDAILPQARMGNDLSGLTIAQLKLNSVGLHGRENELRQIQECLDRRERQLVWLSGVSGAGKTQLALKACRPVMKQNGRGQVVLGKFDANNRKPYLGIVNACAELCGAILHSQQHRQQPLSSTDGAGKLVETMATELHDELPLLVSVIPVLREILDIPFDEEQEGKTKPDSLTTTHDVVLTGSTEAKLRFHFAFVRFLRIVAQEFVPLVIILDDLQWADRSSLDLMEALLTDYQNSNLILVGVYRSNELDNLHPLRQTLAAFETRSRQGEIAVKHIEVTDLTLESVNGIVQDVLSLDNDERTIPLAKVCVKKTHGNPFFVLRFLITLHSKALLRFNVGTLTWMWDLHAIERETQSSENVVDLLRVKMVEYPASSIELLKLASCLGSVFKRRTVEIIWPTFVSVELSSRQELHKAFDILEAEGLIKKLFNASSPSYAWEHDKILEAGSQLIPSSERKITNYRVGRELLRHLGEKEVENSLFIMVDLLNDYASSMYDDKGHLCEVGAPARDVDAAELAHLNLRASKKAVKQSAFEGAAKYTAIGIRLLGEQGWTKHYDLTLDLHRVGAHSECYIGNYETVETYCDKVFSECSESMDDQHDNFMILIESLVKRQKVSDARGLLYDKLATYNVRFYKNPLIAGLQIVRSLLGFKSSLKALEISNLRKMEMGKGPIVMRFLKELFAAQYILQDPMMLLVHERMIQMTTKHGYCDVSTVAIVTRGIMAGGMLGDLVLGAAFAHVGLELLPLVAAKTHACQTIFPAYGMVLPWTTPLRMALKPLLQAYDVGLSVGYVSKTVSSCEVSLPLIFSDVHTH